MEYQILAFFVCAYDPCVILGTTTLQATRNECRLMLCLDAEMDSTTERGANTTPIDGEMRCSRELETQTPGCTFYSFVVCTVVIGLLTVFGSVGNVISFAVFCRDKIKTSTTFLFQVAIHPQNISRHFVHHAGSCLLYTSDAADE